MNGLVWPLPAAFTDLQAWMRYAVLDPNWLRVGTDFAGQDHLQNSIFFEWHRGAGAGQYSCNHHWTGYIGHPVPRT
jgi:hypothetical protein